MGWWRTALNVLMLEDSIRAKLVHFKQRSRACCPKCSLSILVFDHIIPTSMFEQVFGRSGKVTILLVVHVFSQDAVNCHFLDPLLS